MAIVNRDFDASEQNEVIPIRLQNVTTGIGTFLIGLVPYNCEVKAIRLSAFGLSTGVPVFEVENWKFSGGVTINSTVSTATSVGVFSLSGIISLTLGTAGSTQVQCDANSALVLSVTGANGAASILNGEIVVKKLQDIATYFGV